MASRGGHGRLQESGATMKDGMVSGGFCRAILDCLLSVPLYANNAEEAIWRLCHGTDVGCLRSNRFCNNFELNRVCFPHMMALLFVLARQRRAMVGWPLVSKAPLAATQLAWRTCSRTRQWSTRISAAWRRGAAWCRGYNLGVHDRIPVL